ncbi:hypothetical protein AWENTII_007618 [Aspergillus wentii]
MMPSFQTLFIQNCFPRLMREKRQVLHVILHTTLQNIIQNVLPLHVERMFSKYLHPKCSVKTSWSPTSCGENRFISSSKSLHTKVNVIPLYVESNYKQVSSNIP